MSGENYPNEVAKVVDYLFEFQEQNNIDDQLFLDALIDTLAQLFCEEFLGFPEDIDSLLHDIAVEIEQTSFTEPEEEIGDIEIRIRPADCRCGSCHRGVCREDCNEHDIGDVTDREVDSGFDTLEDK